MKKLILPIILLLACVLLSFPACAATERGEDEEDRPRHIEIYYKFLDKALEDKNHIKLPQSA